MRKNILILAHSTETQFIDIYNQYTQLFARDKYLVTVLYLTANENAFLRQHTFAEKIIFANLNKKKLRFFKIGAVQNLISLCRQNHYEMVICHRYKPSYLMMIVAKFCQIERIIFIMHAIGTMRSWRRQWFVTAMWQNNMMLAGVSNAVRDDLRQHLKRIPADHIVTLYNAIDVAKTEPKILSREQARAALGIDETTFAFGHVARLEANKDQANLLRAFALITKHCPQAKLYIVGAGVKETELKSQAASLSEQIIFTGHIPHAFRLMKAFDCFVLSSSQEAFGRVLLEAMLAKVPIIGTAAFGIPEVIGHAGTIVPTKNPVKLADAMRNMYQLSHDKRTQLGEAAYQQMLNHFSLSIFAKQFNHIINVKGSSVIAPY